MPRWDRRLRIVLDWSVALFFRPDITKVDLQVERARVEQDRHLAAPASGTVPAGDAGKQLIEVDDTRMRR